MKNCFWLKPKLVKFTEWTLTPQVLTANQSASRLSRPDTAIFPLDSIALNIAAEFIFPVQGTNITVLCNVKPSNSAALISRL
jgi:hypothetical protein